MPNKKGLPTENEIQTAVRAYLSAVGFYVIRIQQSLGSHLGLSDLIAIRDGVVVFIEIKTLRGKLSEHQHTFDEDVTAHGGYYAVLRSVEDAAMLDRWVSKTTTGIGS